MKHDIDDIMIPRRHIVLQMVVIGLVIAVAVTTLAIDYIAPIPSN